MRHYLPQDRPELPFEIAKLETADAAGIERFARQWGLLGYFDLRLFPPHTVESTMHPFPEWKDREIENPGDPADWVQRHAQVLGLCISLVDGLARKDEEGLFRTLESFYAPSLTKPLKEELAGKPPSDWARITLSSFVSEQIKGIKPALEEDGTIGFKYTAMVEIAYVHVARLAGERSQIDRCEECGAPFKKTHGLQRFCPPGPFDSESRCSYRQRYKRFKSREAKS